MSSGSVIFKILTVFLLFCLTKASGGTCLSYGHSCWGGHGKRNGVAGPYAGPNTQKRNEDWYISRLLNPSFENTRKIAEIFKNKNSDSDDYEKFRRFGYRIYPLLNSIDSFQRDESRDGDSDFKTAKGLVDSNNSDEVVMLSPETQQLPISKYKLLQIMDQDEGKKRGAN